MVSMDLREASKLFTINFNITIFNIPSKSGYAIRLKSNVAQPQLAKWIYKSVRKFAEVARSRKFHAYHWPMPFNAILTIMRRTYERGTKARLSFSGGPHAPVNMVESMEEVNVGGKKLFAVLYCAIFLTPSFRKSLKFFRTSITSLDPEPVELQAFSILSAMFIGAWTTREDKPRFGVALESSAHVCETRL